FVETALLGLISIKAGRLRIAQSILEDVKFATSATVALSYVMRGFRRFIIWMGMLLYVLYPLIFVALSTMSEGDVGFKTILKGAADLPLSKVLLSAFFGCLGGVVSLLMRLSEFETTRGRSKEFLLLSGSTLPVVGGILASVIAALLASQIINVGTLTVWHY